MAVRDAGTEWLRVQIYVRKRLLPRGMAELTEEARRAHGRDGT
jgi:hypothetical protein